MKITINEMKRPEVSLYFDDEALKLITDSIMKSEHVCIQLNDTRYIYIGTYIPQKLQTFAGQNPNCRFIQIRGSVLKYSTNESKKFISEFKALIEKLENEVKEEVTV